MPHVYLCSAFNVDPIYQKVVLSGLCLSHAVHAFKWTWIIPRLSYQRLNQIDIKIKSEQERRKNKKFPSAQYLKEQAHLGAWVNTDMCEIGAMSKKCENVEPS